MSDDAGELFDGLSRELQLRCAPDGTIVWLDRRARDVLGIDRGARLAELAAPGTEEKIERLLVDGTPDASWEVVLAVRDEPVVLAFRSRRSAEGVVALTGSQVPADYASTLGQLGASMSELAALHRETDRQQRELLRRHEELVRLHRELEDSHRGVVALHHEIGEKDDSLRRADEVKARLVANVSHEFRTPLNSILGLTNLLLSHADGDLNHEQEIQLGFIRQSCESLYALVNDLLDLSKMEAGKVSLHIGTFEVAPLFAAMRGMLRPLVPQQRVELELVDPTTRIEIESDESKIAQILRNLVSNALKFTPSGTVRVTAEVKGDEVSFHVRDTGIGIPPEHQQRVFDEFYQVDGELQRTLRGTGLGLSLSQHIAARLGGEITLASAPGEGSTFTLTIPRRHPEATELSALADRSRNLAPDQQPVLVVEDDRQTLFLYEKYLRGSGFQVVPARTVDEARAALRTMTPAAIVLDIMLEGEAT
ncbi:MAG TPA: ATP-binding protein [Nannocystaceae bacterium]|nr:ATP-binding protein [Nannocystaceae bacterium]